MGLPRPGGCRGGMHRHTARRVCAPPAPPHHVGLSENCGPAAATGSGTRFPDADNRSRRRPTHVSRAAAGGVKQRSTSHSPPHRLARAPRRAAVQNTQRCHLRCPLATPLSSSTTSSGACCDEDRSDYDTPCAAAPPTIASARLPKRPLPQVPKRPAAAVIRATAAPASRCQGYR